MALPFITLAELDDKKFRFTLGDMLEFQQWAASKVKTEGDGPPDMQEIFGVLGEDLTILVKLLWLGLRHYDEGLEEADVADLIHMGAVPALIAKTTSFIVSPNGKTPPKNLPRPAPRKVVPGRNNKAGTGAKPSKRPAASA